ncbi:hypothetical protein WJX72_003561 [[Myrmecia] bisecta]|uniref:Uncharacterized protein n=1 Tax=[Myrmecia] bisecta TaxID=41462 RepID=A0AAW1PDP2_9CHLO
MVPCSVGTSRLVAGHKANHNTAAVQWQAVHVGLQQADGRSLLDRRQLLRHALLGSWFAVAGAGLAATLPQQAAAVLGSRADDVLQHFWLQNLLPPVQQYLGAGFSAGLVTFSAHAVLPSGSPGDPSKDYASERGDHHCGIYQGVNQPYPCCGSKPTDLCCRHYAYAVPYARYGLAKADRVSTVVVSPRAVQLPEKNWQAILMHEMGHCIDFHLFGRRYGLADRAPAVQLARLHAIDQQPDPEARADLLANLFLAEALGACLCYDAASTLQLLVAEGNCQAPGLLQHYPHAPLQGRAPKYN